MKHLLASTVAFFGIAGAAYACPNYSLEGTEFYTGNGGDLYSAPSFDIVAGGENFLPDCGFQNNEVGYFTTAPDFTFDLSDMDYFEKLVISVQSNCDSALLINTDSTHWFYDDDSNGNGDPRLDIVRVGDGILDVWIGTFDGAYCDAVLTLETF
jgi:hypothetical protein